MLSLMVTLTSINVIKYPVKIYPKAKTGHQHMALSGYCISDNNKSVNPQQTHSAASTFPRRFNYCLSLSCLLQDRSQCQSVWQIETQGRYTSPQTPQNQYQLAPILTSRQRIQNICSIFLMALSHHLMSQSFCCVSRTSPNDDGKSHLNIKTEEPHAVE